MKPMFIHVHVYYPEIWPEIRDLLTNPDLPTYELAVTMVEEHVQVREEAKALCPNARVLMVENRGYDIWPFLHVLRTVDLSKYSYCIKLHTKRDLPRYASLESRQMPYPFHGALWREYLLSVLQPDNLKKTLRAFQEDNRLGMVADFRIILHRDVGDSQAYADCVNLIRSMGQEPKPFPFVAGSMFMCRACLLKPLQELPYTAKDFDAPTAEHPRTLAHVLERYFGWIVAAQGYTLRDAYTGHPERRIFLRRLYAGGKRFLFQHKITKKGKRLIKICSIPIYSARVKVEKDKP